MRPWIFRQRTQSITAPRAPRSAPSLCAELRSALLTYFQTFIYSHTERGAFIEFYISYHVCKCALLVKMLWLSSQVWFWTSFGWINYKKLQNMVIFMLPAPRALTSWGFKNRHICTFFRSNDAEDGLEWCLNIILSMWKQIRTIKRCWVIKFEIDELTTPFRNRSSK